MDESILELLKVLHYHGMINNFPDITREEKDKQILNFDKMMIEHQGWDSWCTNEMEALKNLNVKEKEPAEYKSIMKRIKKLELWAKEKGYIEPIHKRINSEKKQKD